MRTIKFRGKSLESHEWVYGYLYELPSDSGNVCMILTTDNIHEDNSIKPQYHLAFTLWKDLFVVDSSTIGQHTGLLDKNGEEIYEGDILGLPEADSNGVQFRNRFARVVEWINDGFFLIDREERCGEVRKYGDRLALEISLNSNYAGMARCLEKHNYAVIGNVHDNPELLKGE